MAEKRIRIFDAKSGHHRNVLPHIIQKGWFRKSKDLWVDDPEHEKGPAKEEKEIKEKLVTKQNTIDDTKSKRNTGSNRTKRSGKPGGGKKSRKG